MPNRSADTPAAAAHWLNPSRLLAYGGTVLLASLIYFVRCAWYSWNSAGHPNGMDFTTFWAASRLWLDGRPLDAYSLDALTRAAHLISPKLGRPPAFFYPPNFLLFLRPLAWLPSPLAYVSFAIVTTGVFIVLLRKVLPMRGALVPMLGFSGIWLTVAFGQNACMTASLALGAFLLLEKRPIAAGVCIGMMSIKPHLAILFPLALACAGMWTAFVAAGVTAIALTCVSVAVFGVAAIPAFLHAMTSANHGIATGALPWYHMASLFAALRLAHVPATPAYAAQACVAIIAAGAVMWTWRRCAGLAVRATALVAGTFMASPYNFNYDTAWLAIPIALLTAHALRTGWLRGEREILCVAWLYPALGELTGIFLHADVGPLVFGSLLFVAIRRARAENQTARATAHSIESPSISTLGTAHQVR